MAIIDHIGLGVADFDRSLAFYTAALEPLGITVIMQFPAGGPAGDAAAGLGRNGKPDLWISGSGKTSPHIHIALAAENRAAVDAFYQAALAAGGTDNGQPGVRVIYHPDYYGAFVIDPDGHNIEAVCHRPA